MADPAVINAETGAAATAGDRSVVLIWHGAWLAALAIAFAGLLAALPFVPWPIVWAFALGAAPALAAMALNRYDSPATRSLLLVLWAVCGGAACGMGGGVSGPLAAWCLAPVAAATLLGSSRLWAEAAALSVLAGAVAALAQLAHLWPAAPPEPLRFLLGLLALATLGLGLAAGLTLSRRRLEADRASDRTAREGLERLLTRQPNLLATFDAQGRVLSAYGYCPAALSETLLLEQSLIACADPADRAELADGLRAGLEGGRVAVAFRPLGHAERHMEITLARVEPGRLVGVLQDVTAIRVREAELETARVDAETLSNSKTRFLANMSHELRTPLNTIMGFSDMMRAKLFGPLPPKYAEYAELIHESGRHLLDLINDVLDMSKIEADRYQLQLEAIDARDPVSSGLRLMRVQADEAGILLRANLPAAPLQVQADSRALKQIVLNLLSNALKFTPRGGRVDLTLEVQDEMLELVVADSGVGIAPEDVKRLGQPFQQAGDAAQRAKGAGLGLSLVRAIAELHGGQMIIESALGVGTSVIVRLPGPILEPQPQDRPTAKVIAFNPKAG